MKDWDEVTADQCLKWQIENELHNALRQNGEIEEAIRYECGSFWAQNVGPEGIYWNAITDPGNLEFAYFIPAVTQ